MAAPRFRYSCPQCGDVQVMHLRAEVAHACPKVTDGRGNRLRVVYELDPEGIRPPVPADANLSRCKTCHAPIMWTVTPADKLMPLDVMPGPDGNVRLDGDVATVLGPLEVLLALEAGTPLYVPHWATCPDADQHRRT